MTIDVTTRSDGPVGEIRFARPPLNFANPDLLHAIADASDAFDADPAIRCMVLHSEGKPFCAGADLAGDGSLTGGDGMDAVAQLYVQALRLFRRQKPMVAAIQGAAVGAGLGLALAADFRVAGPGARFSANFVRLGFHPGFAITHTLPRLIGEQKAAWMMLSATRAKPEEALAWGLADRLAGADDLLDATRAMAHEIAENAPLALLAVRRTLGGGLAGGGGLADAAEAAMRHEHAEQAALKQTADYAEGVASVFERREARFTGT